MLVLLALLQAASAVNIHKCCPSGQSLDITKQCVVQPAFGELYPKNLPPGIGWVYSKGLCKPKDSYLVAYNNATSLSESGSVSLVNITFPVHTFCLDYVNSTPVLRMCPCLVFTCIRKCCLFDEILEIEIGKLNGSCQKTNLSDDWSPNFIRPGIPVMTFNEFPTCHSMLGSYPLSTDTSKDAIGYSIQEDGSVIIADDKVIGKNNYCYERTLIDGKILDNLMICSKSIHRRGFFHRILYGVLLVIGSVFLLLTLVVQYSLAELRRTVHSRNLISHTFSLFVGYLILSVQSFGPVTDSAAVCSLLGYITQFAFIASFFWLNVMCIDITWTFSGFRAPDGNSINESEVKKYIYYSIYVWGSSLIIVLITLSVDMFNEGARIAPSFAAHSCWFKYKLPTFIFFYFPITILLLTNVFLFIYTSFKIMKVRRDTGVLLREDGMRNNSRFARFSEFRYSLYLKLSLLMGISWIFEVIAWAADNEEKYFYFYIFTDAFNSLRGVFIFFLFSRKRKLAEIIRSKLSTFSGIGDKIRRRRPETSSSKSCPDSSTLYTSHPTLQTHTE